MTELKTCKDFCKHLSDYLEGEIGERECRLIRAHLEQCPPCALAFRSLRTTVDLCCKGVTDAMPQDVKNRLRKFLRDHCCKELEK